jgi:thioredoxin-related protein
MRLLLFVLPLAALLAAPATAAPGKAAVTWRDWNAGVKEAESSNRFVLVDVYTDWCGWCKRMDKDVYSRNDVRDYLNQRFVTVRLNAESDIAASYEGKAYTGRSLANRFRVSGYPTTIFLRPGGSHIANVPGYVPADRFLLLLKYIGEGHLDRGVLFDDFVKQQTAGSEKN